MTSSSAGFSILMLFAGAGIPVMAALNADLGARIDNPAAAAFILFFIGLCVTGVALLVTGAPSRSMLGATPIHYFAGGFFVAFYVLSITWAAPRIGVGNAVFLVLLSQLISAAAIDHFGVFGAVQTTITPQRAAGLLIMALGVFLAVRRDF